MTRDLACVLLGLALAVLLIELGLVRTQLVLRVPEPIAPMRDVTPGRENAA